MPGAETSISRIVIRVIAIAAAIAAASAAVALYASTKKAAISIGAGAAIGAASFIALAVAVSGAARPGPAGMRAGLFTGISILKLAVVGAALWWLISRSIVEPVSFLVGFTAVVVALVFERLRAARAGDRAG